MVSDVLGKRAGAYLTTLLLCRALEDLNVNVTCFTTWIEPGHSVANEGFAVVKPHVTRGYRWDWPNRSIAMRAISYIKRRKPSSVIVIGATRLCHYLLSSSIANRLLIWELTDACGNKFVDVNAVKLLPRCRAMLSPSTTVDLNIRAHYQYRGEIKRLPFWVEDCNSEYKPVADGFMADFIYLGRLDEEKGLRELISATAELAAEIPSVRIVVGGYGSVEPFESLVANLEIEENIVFTSFKSRREICDALTGSRFLVLPSYHEGYPLVLLEAARSSLPFVATDVGSVREIYGESKACVLVQARDTESLVQGMKQLMSESVDVYAERKRASHELFHQLSSSNLVTEKLTQLLISKVHR